MNRTLLIVIGLLAALLTAAGCSSTQIELPAQTQTFEKWIEKTETEVIEEVRTLPDKDINLGAVALILAKEYYPDIDVKKYLGQLDQMALELKRKIGDETNQEKVIQIINKHILSKTFSCDSSDTNKSFSLNSVLDNKSGSCLGLSILYLTMAERLNLPLYAVGIPSHMFIRYDDDVFQRNIDTTIKGEMISDNDYIQRLKDPWKTYLGSISKADQVNVPPERKKRFLELNSPIILLPEDVTKKRGGYFTNSSKKDVIIELINNYAYQHSKHSEADRVKIMYDKAKALNIVKPYHWTMIGISLGQADVYEDAIKCLTEAIKQEPNFHLFYYNRMRVYDDMGKYPEVESDCNKALELFPNNSKYHYSRGRNYDLMQEYDKALADFTRVIELTPDDYQGYYARGVVLKRKSEYDKALKDLDRSIELNPDYAKAYSTRADCKIQKDDFDGAIADWEQAIKLDPLKEQYLRSSIDELKEILKEPK